MYWLERNLSQEQEDAEGNPTIGDQRDKKEKVSRGGKNPPPPTDLLAKCSKKLGDIWSLSYVTSADTSGGGISTKTSSLRRVSFAPCDQAEEAGPSSPARDSVDIVSSSSDDKDCEVSEMLRVPSAPDREELQVSGKSPVSEALKPDNEPVQTADVFDGKLVGVKNPKMKPLSEEVLLTTVEQEVKKPIKRKKSAKSKEKSIYYLEPRLPPRDYPPPPPPPDVRHYTRSTNPSLLDRKSQSDDDCFSYHIKKKLLALKLHEKAAKKASRDRLPGMSSLNSSGSDDINENKGTCEGSGLGHGPIFHSTPDSRHSLIDDVESNPTVYYTPKQSMVTCCSQDLGGSEEMPILASSPLIQEDEATTEQDAILDKPLSNAGSAASGSTHSSVDSSSSAPSFLIGSSTQLCQCIGNGDDDSSEKFKRVLDKLTTVDNQVGVKSTSHENKKLCLVDESWWEKFEKSYPEDSIDDLSADGDDILDFEASGSPSVSYHQIDLEDLLCQIYHDSALHHSSAADSGMAEEAGGSIVNTPDRDSAAESRDNTTESCKLESLVDFLCGTSGPGDLTTYEQKEMSLEDVENNGMDPPKETPVVTLSELPPQHITIEMPEESSFFSSVGATIATRSERSPVMSPFHDYFAGSNTQSFELTNSADDSKVDCETKDSQAFCDDLIDINFDEEKVSLHGSPKGDLDENESHALAQTSEDWTDVSAEYLIASLPNDISLDGDPSNISQLDSSQETSRGSLDLSLDSSLKKRLTVDFKRGSGDAKTLAQLKKMSPEARKDATDVGMSSLVKDSLCSATDILEKSHDSLAKSVHGLCRRAIIKQSNVSLELVLPTEKQQALDVDGVEGVKCFNNGTSPPKASVLNVKLNSSITYPTLEEQALQKVKRD